MPRRSKSNGKQNEEGEETEGNSVAAHVRERQRAVAEREAERLARPEKRTRSALAHANRKLSAVSSTPFGFLASSNNNRSRNDEQHDEEWCGPFSVARQMIAQREEAKRKREEELDGSQEEHHPLDDLMDEVQLQQQRKIHPSMQWKSKLAQSKDGVVVSSYTKRQRRIDLSKSQTSRISSLFQLTVNFIVDNFEHVESIGVVENDVRVAIANELIARNQLDAKALEALVEPHTMETLEISDCSGISQDALSSVLGSIAGLRHVLLTHAGRCFGRKAVKALLNDNPTSALCCLSVDGAYLLRDEDLAELIRAHESTLQSLAFQSCPLLGDQFVKSLQKPQPKLLELSLDQMSFSTDQLDCLSKAKDSLQNLQSLTLRSLTGLTDAILDQFLETATESLERLDIGFNFLLGDATLSSIRKYSSLRLKTLVLDGIKGITGPGLEALFTHPLQGLPPPPKLKVLRLASMDHEAVTDGLLNLVVEGYHSNASAGNMMTEANGEGDFRSHSSNSFSGKHSRRNVGTGLVQLDVQGSTMVTDHLLEHLVETSANTLESLNVSYCPLIQDQGLGYLVSKIGQQLTKIEVWGCAQLTDDFFDGHDRVRDGTLEIVGAWMKKSGTRSLR